MKIVIAPDSFKESLSAREVADAIERGLRAIFPDASYLKLPFADGGEGTLDAILAALGGAPRRVSVSGPLGEPVEAIYGLTADGLAIIEMAAASGLTLVPPARRNPLVTTSRGTGELIRAARAAGARRVVIGIGGSATNDGGAGMLQALGVRLLDADGRELGPGGAELARLAHLDASRLDPRLAGCPLAVACDVTNPLTGARGASRVFGPQKGATPAMVEILDASLARFAAVLKADLGRDVADMPGAGAAGGLGAALLAVLEAQLRPGVDIVAEALDLERALADADLVVTGEGRLDGQSLSGKTPIGIARVASRQGIPTIALAGSLAATAEAVHQHGIDAVFSATQHPGPLAQALREARPNIESAARNIAAAIRIGMELAQRHATDPLRAATDGGLPEGESALALAGPSRRRRTTHTTASSIKRKKHYRQ